MSHEDQSKVEVNRQPWHKMTVSDVLSATETEQDGLSSTEAAERLERHGRNSLRKHESPGLGRILIRQFKSIVIIVMILAGTATVAMQMWPESIAIAAVIVVNAAIGFFTEWRAMQSMAALRKLAKQHTQVRRDGDEQELPASDLVPGDVVVLRAEATVPADLRIIDAEGLRTNEATLTGESVPVAKQTDPVEADAVLSDRVNMLYQGTAVVDGKATGVVVATGMDTEVGRVSELTEEAESAATPLQAKLDSLGRRMAVIVLCTALVIGTIGLLAGRDTMLMIETALALGVAAIPEGLPIVATIALAAGMWMMARRNALVNQLPAVETLGATRVIFTDKTGTLTENKMVVSAIETPQAKVDLQDDQLQTDDQQTLQMAQRALRIGVLCNGAKLGEANDSDENGPRGDPMEIALLEAGINLDFRRQDLVREMEQVRQVPFDRETMMMATVHRDSDGRILMAIKGAPQAVLDTCNQVAVDMSETRPLADEDRRRFEDRADELAGQGLRLLGLAEKRTDDPEVNPYEKLTWLGMVALYDPPREQVRDAINACQAAGIRVVMVTGDKPETAQFVAEAVGIVGDPDDETAQLLHGRDLKAPEELAKEDEERIHATNIFARVTPEQKLNLVQIYQDIGDTVAMTGDGVNDAPALKKADIGVAMGQRGTAAAKQVAAMVLRDDAFETIVAAVEQGRIIFNNIRKSVMFILCTNGAEVLAVATASLLNAPLPLRPLQILYLNVLTDVFPALALAVGKGEPDTMKRPPRPSGESVLTRRHWAAIGGWSVLMSACVLGGLYTGLGALGLDDFSAVTVSFLTLAFGKLWFVFNLRSPQSTLLNNPVSRNPWIWGSFGLCIAMLIAAVYMPGLSDVLDTRPLGLKAWGLVLLLSLIPVAVGQTILWLRKHKSA